MPYKIVQPTHQHSQFQSSVQLDLSRDTAILIRQSRRGSDKAHFESRMLQESLIPFVMAARGEGDLSHIRIFDEGAGVSGRLGIDKRKKLRSMMDDMVSDVIGDIVLARPDRLFRDKHFANVSAFTELAEQMRVKVIVPKEKGITVFDFTRYDDLKEFQRAMQEAYAYIDTQIGYMNRARAFKVAKGFYGGWNIALPYVLLRDMPKEEQVQIIYEPWQEAALDLFQKFTEFHFESGRIARYVEDKPYIFKFMPEADLEEYMTKTTMRKAQGGYTFSRLETLVSYLSNLTLAGFAYGGKDTDGTTILIPNAFNAAIPLDLLEPCFAAITGEYLDGTPFLKARGQRQFRKHDTAIDAILHGLVESDNGSVNALAQIDHDYPLYTCLRHCHFAHKARVGQGRMGDEWALPVRHIDKIVLDRLIDLAEYDNGMVERVKEYFGTVSQEGESALTVLDTAIAKTQIAFRKTARTITILIQKMAEEEGLEEKDVELDPSDPLMKEYRELSATLRRLKRQRDEAARVAGEDPTKSITDFYHVLAHLRSEFTKKDPQTKKDIIRKLVDEVKINAISPHLFTLHITWIRPLAEGRDDVALLWRSIPTKSDDTNCWTPQEEAALRKLYPRYPQWELLQAIPNKTTGQMKKKAHERGIKRDFWHIERTGRLHETVCYKDLHAVEAFTAQSEVASLLARFLYEDVHAVDTLTTTTRLRDYLWSQINQMAEQSKKGELTAMWFLPIDLVSFSHGLCVTDAVETALPAPALQSPSRCRLS